VELLSPGVLVKVAGNGEAIWLIVTWQAFRLHAVRRPALHAFFVQQ
jgi:hypothetical protein